MCLSFDTAPLIIMDTYFFSFSRSRISVSKTSSLLGAGGAGGAAGTARRFLAVSLVSRRDEQENRAKAIIRKSKRALQEIVHNPEVTAGAISLPSAHFGRFHHPLQSP